MLYLSHQTVCHCRLLVRRIVQYDLFSGSCPDFLGKCEVYHIRTCCATQDQNQHLDQTVGRWSFQLGLECSRLSSEYFR